MGLRSQIRILLGIGLLISGPVFFVRLEGAEGSSKGCTALEDAGDFADPRINWIELSEYARGTVRRLLKRYTRDRSMIAESLQDAFVRALENQADFRGESDVKTWFTRIAINVLLDNMRRAEKQRTNLRGNKVNPDILFNNSADPKALPADEAVIAQIRAVENIIGKALALLPKDFRAVFEMVGLQGLEYGEVAKELNIPPGTVRSRFSRARGILEERYPQLFDEADIPQQFLKRGPRGRQPLHRIEKKKEDERRAKQNRNAS